MILALSSAYADEVQVGGAVDFLGGLDTNRDNAVIGLRQLEGDLRAEGQALAFEVQLDTAATFTGDGVFLYALGPERLVGEGFGKNWRVALGVEAAPFRMESVDPWRNAMVTYTLLSRHVPASVLGGSFVLGNQQASLTLLAGGELATTNVFALDTLGPVPFVAGARGKFDVEIVEIGLGAWAGGQGQPVFGGLEVGARVDAGLVGAQVEAVSDFRSVYAVSAQGEVFPGGLMSPVARVEFAPEGFGVGAGLSSTLFDVLRLKAEATYQAGAAGVFLEAALFSNWPGDDAPRGGNAARGKND